MVKIVYIIRKRTDLSFDEFSKYWRTEHAALVKRVGYLLGIRRYVQSHVIAPEIGGKLSASRESLEPFDGVAEIYFDSLEAFGEGHFSAEVEEAQRSIIADEDVFLDRKRSSIFLSEDHVIIGE